MQTPAEMLRSAERIQGRWGIHFGRALHLLALAQGKVAVVDEILDRVQRAECWPMLETLLVYRTVEEEMYKGIGNERSRATE